MKSVLSPAILIMLWASVPVSAEVNSSWKIVHLDAICGISTSYVSSKYLRRDFPKMNVVTIASSPRWKMQVFNPKRKMYYETSLADWRKDMFFSTSGLGLSDSASAQNLHYGRGEPVTIKGLKAKRYLLVLPKPGPRERSRGPFTRTVEVCLADDILLVPGLARVWSNFYYIPLTDHLPLRVVHHASRGKSYVILDTETVEKKVVDASLLTLPRGYKLAKTALEVQSGGQIDQMIKEMIGEDTE